MKRVTCMLSQKSVDRKDIILFNTFSTKLRVLGGDVKRHFFLRVLPHCQV
jgi:hypothetical protein